MKGPSSNVDLRRVGLKGSLVNEDISKEYDPLIDSKIERTTDGLSQGLTIQLKRLSALSPQNTQCILSFLDSLTIEINASSNHKMNYIGVLCRLSRFHNSLLFTDMTRDDIISFLSSARKPEESDPLHKWIGTYNLYDILLTKFFKWLHYPDLESDKRPKPLCVENIPLLRRKEKSIYKSTDLWSEEDDLLFLKYCPSKRDRCYHMISRDTSCRPHELLKLKIKDVVFQTTGRRQYAEVVVNGKTGTRHVPVVNSIPYVKDWLDDHPQRGNPNAIFICGFGKSLGRGLTTYALDRIYADYQKKFFPKLFKDPHITPEDKNKIKELLRKPWNPYIRRHTALTEKSRVLKESELRQHAGWSGGSLMPVRYTHYLGNESTNTLLQHHGLVPGDRQLQEQLKPKECPNCTETNKPDSRFCAKCRMVLSYDAYQETVEEQHQQTDAFSALSDHIMKLTAEVQELKSKK